MKYVRAGPHANPGFNIHCNLGYAEGDYAEATVERRLNEERGAHVKWRERQYLSFIGRPGEQLNELPALAGSINATQRVRQIESLGPVR